MSRSWMARSGSWTMCMRIDAETGNPGPRMRDLSRPQRIPESGRCEQTRRRLISRCTIQFCFPPLSSVWSGGVWANQAWPNKRARLLHHPDR